MLHGLIMGAVSGAGGYVINNYGNELGRVGKIASSAVLGGVVSEIGGGKFANGAITAAYSMMFNEFMHEQYTKRANSQLSLLFDGEKVYVMDKEGNKIYSTTATSGKGEHMNNPSLQNVENLGPIPQGIYSYNNSKWKTMTKWQQCKRLIRGGDWGTHNVPLDVVNNNHSTRRGFYLHGGIIKGSAGCIDVGSNIGKIYNLTKSQRITYVYVRY